jgi:hypothetical protein
MGNTMDLVSDMVLLTLHYLEIFIYVMLKLKLINLQPFLLMVPSGVSPDG